LNEESGTAFSHISSFYYNLSRRLQTPGSYAKVVFAANISIEGFHCGVPHLVTIHLYYISPCDPV
jgi:hypothetical protein